MTLEKYMHPLSVREIYIPHMTPDNHVYSMMQISIYTADIHIYATWLDNQEAFETPTFWKDMFFNIGQFFLKNLNDYGKKKPSL